MPNFGGGRPGFWWIPKTRTPSETKKVLLVGERVTDWVIRSELYPIFTNTFDFNDINNYRELFLKYANNYRTPTNIDVFQTPTNVYNRLNSVFPLNRDYSVKNDMDWLAEKATIWFNVLGYDVTYRNSYQELVDNENSQTISEYDQVWDIVFAGKADFGFLGQGLNQRGPGSAINYNNLFPPQVKQLYVDYVTGGGSLLLLGENKGPENPLFTWGVGLYRDVAIMMFIEDLGGGNISARNFAPKGTIDMWVGFPMYSVDPRNDGLLTRGIPGGNAPYSLINPEFLIDNSVPGYYHPNAGYFNSALYKLNKLGTGTPFAYFTSKARRGQSSSFLKQVPGEDATYVSAAIWKKGSLSKAPEGTIMVIFDSDFVASETLNGSGVSIKEYYQTNVMSGDEEDRLFFNNVVATLQEK